MDFKIEDIAAARLSLSRMDDVLSKAHDVAPVFKWRKKPKGFKGLAFLIIEQQVSTASANAIIKTFTTGLGSVTPANTLAAGESRLKTFGLSGQKAGYIHLLARACADGELNFAKLRKLPDDDAIAELVRLKGIGRWTAEAYLMFSEGRTDLFPAGDLALQEGYRLAAHRKTRPTEKELYKIAEKWRPNRGIAALLLWAYYGHRKSRPQKPPVNARA
jgi:DNA-3-methyladenine glycosylase II